MAEVKVLIDGYALWLDDKRQKAEKKLLKLQTLLFQGTEECLKLKSKH